ncbi:MAG TPA: pentapeptide repeat-containing protein, partial [Allosphingosinicella sp.]|nr:pentapeptide repeat-containing protein [Allosphingosinicella sp.]
RSRDLDGIVEFGGALRDGAGGMTLALLLAAQLAAPPPQDCQAALGPLYEGTQEAALPGQVDGTTLGGDGRALIALRRTRGDALITVKGGNFAGADFRRARLHNICFLDANLSGSDWRGTEARGVGFVRTNLGGATLAGAHLDRVLIRNSDFSNVHGERAILAGGRLDGGWFEGKLDNFRLDDADLTGFRFECSIGLDDGCPVYTGEGEFSLRGANLTRANLYWWATLDGATIDRTEVPPRQLRDIRNARLTGPILVQGYETNVEITPDEYRTLLPHILDPERPQPEIPPPPQRPAGPPDWARPGVTALFVNAPALFDDAFRDTALYRRLVPALIAASEMHVIVTVRPDGGIDASGESVGANFHMCSLEGEGLRLDPATGYYSGPYEMRPEDPPGWRGKQAPVLALIGDRAEVYGYGRLSGSESEYPAGDYASCGARASFDAMIRVPASAAEIERLRAGPDGEAEAPS